jgi:hypothetical protein
MYGGSEPKNKPAEKFAPRDSAEKPAEEKPSEEKSNQKSSSSSVQQTQQQLFSTNAYLLFYRKKSDKPTKARDMPEYLKQFIKQDNIKFQKVRSDLDDDDDDEDDGDDIDEGKIRDLHSRKKRNG